MSSITLRRAGVLFPLPLFRDLDLVLQAGDRLGLVAANGGGKSTLLRCIAGEAELGAGEILRSRGLRVAFVPQDVPDTLRDLTMAEAVRRGLDARDRAANAWKAGLALDAFDTPAELRDRPVHALSGGWQRLALVARAAVAEPDALLLDEPTNHLDTAKIELLERWINGPSRHRPMVVASHDRRFLDSCTTRTLFLRPDTSFLSTLPYARARRALDESEASQAAKLARDTREAGRLRRSAAELRNIGVNSRSDAAQKKSAQMAQRADALEQSLRPVASVRPGDIKLGSSASHARVVATFDDLVVRAPDGALLFRTGRQRVMQGDRVVLAGPNGVGKSVLLRLLHQAVTAPGSVPGLTVSPAVQLGYVDQQMAHLPAGDGPFGHIGGFRLGDARTRSLLAGAGFPVDRQHVPIAQLSPGQKARLGLLALRLLEPNFFLMDEPTNHVDIPGQERLEAEILDRSTTCLLVSHDRSFVDAVATRRWEVVRGMLVEVG